MYKANAVYIVTGREWMIFMKNRDNEFFDQQKLDELVKNRDLDTLRDQMVRILACPCCLNGFKHCRKYLKVFSVEEIQQTPYLATAAALICAIYGDLKQAEELSICGTDSFDEITFGHYYSGERY